MRWIASASKTWFEIRVHPCNLQLQNKNLYENKDSFPSAIDPSTSSLEKGLGVVTDNFQNVKVLSDNEKMGGNDNVFGNELMCPIDGESGKNENILNLEDAIDIQQNTEQGTSIQNNGCYHNNQKHPKVKDFVEYKIFGLLAKTKLPKALNYILLFFSRKRRSWLSH